MKNIKRILAVIGVILLIGMYVCTLIFALIGSPASDDLVKSLYSRYDFNSGSALRVYSDHPAFKK